MGRSVRVRLFGPARQAVGRAELRWPVSASTVSARELLARLTERYPRLRPILRSSRFLRNGEYLEDLATLIGVNDELAVHPPYGGG